MSFHLKSSPNLLFEFNTVAKYQQGVTLYNALQLNVEAVDTQWDLYVGTSTVAPESWDVVQNYGASLGKPAPPPSLLQIRVSNANSTPQTGSGFTPLTDIASPVYIIGSHLGPDAGNPCGAVGVATNTAGNYLTYPGCYRFNVDLKLVPGFQFRPGLYQLRVDFWIIADL